MPAIPDLHSTTALIRARRSLKPTAMDGERQIPRPLLATLLENATWAPTHGMTEPWHFEIYEGESRTRFAETLQSLYDAATPPDQIRPEKRAKLGTHPLLAPTLVLLVCRPGGNPKIPLTEEIEAVACAAQNLHLTATAAGLGGFWSSPPCLGHETAPTALDLKPTDHALGIFYLGWPTTEIPPAPKRTPWEEKSIFRA